MFSGTPRGRAGIQSAMCAPLGNDDPLRGLLYVDNLSRRDMFTVDDLNVFAVIAVQAGLAIEREAFFPFAEETATSLPGSEHYNPRPIVKLFAYLGAWPGS